MADLIVVGETTLTQNKNRDVITGGAVAVKGSTIIDVGPEEQIMRDHGDGARVLNSGRSLVMPGLINTHTHVSMTCFRGLADDMPLMTWLHENIFPAEQKLTKEIVYWGALLGCAEMILSGTTSFGDMYLFETAVARAAEKSGLRALLGEVLYDFPSPSYGPIEKGLIYTENLIDEWASHERISIAVEPHAPYTCAPELLIACRDLADKKGVRLITHLSENQEEVDGIKDRYGATPVGHLEALGLLSPNLIADHCVVLDDSDISLLAKRGVNVAHNPSSNMKLASGIAPIPQLLAAGVTVGLGTDGAASNNNLDMFGEMDMAAKAHKVASMDPTVMDADTVMNMATTAGAEVLGFGDKVGVLAKGYRADIIVLDLDQPHLTPMYNPFSHLVYSAAGADVVHSIVHGNVLMENRSLTTMDLEEIYSHMDEIAETMRDGHK